MELANQTCDRSQADSGVTMPSKALCLPVATADTGKLIAAAMTALGGAGNGVGVVAGRGGSIFEQPNDFAVALAPLLGRLGADPEVRAFDDGGRIANFSLATSESWRDPKSGETKVRTQWHKISVTGSGLVGIVEKYLAKGSRIYLQGSLSTRKWKGEDGKDRFTTEVVVRSAVGVIVLLDVKREGGGESADEAEAEAIEDVPS
jgi:single-strand DNA-binding protein